MITFSARTLGILAISGAIAAAPAPVCAQTTSAGKPAAPTIEFGLETAVNWKWWVVPSEPQNWGLPQQQPDAEEGAAPGPPKEGAAAEARPTTYEVQRGDALVKIANRFGVTVEQLKAFNGLTRDLIRIGDVLKIPNLEDIKKMAPPPPPPGSEKKGTQSSKAPAPPPQRQLSLPSGRNWDTVLLQVFLDREQFSTGLIDGRAGPTFEAIMELFQNTNEGMEDPLVLKEKARSVVDDPFTVYTLKEEDFRFIMSSDDIQRAEAAKAAAAASSRSRKSKSRSSSTAFTPPPPTYDELVAASRLIYRTPWEFVAERFHCEEAFLRSLNSNLKGIPAIGAQFHVPNVVPFEVEKVFDEAVQPAPDPEKPVTAAVVGLSRFEIYRGGSLIAAMPLALARPDLRGRGTWTIREAIPGPRLATLQESKSQPKPASATFGAAASTTEAAPPPDQPKVGLDAEQHLAAGPNNPVGVIWIHLSKTKDGEPLPYGLHGTSIPDRMRSLEGIGGLRLANWDIMRAARLLPAGTPLQWK